MCNQQCYIDQCSIKPSALMPISLTSFKMTRSTAKSWFLSENPRPKASLGSPQAIGDSKFVHQQYLQRDHIQD